MFKNLIKSAFRNLMKKPAFTAINIFGLAIGMATCLSILMYVDHETSFDDFQQDDVYRMALNRVYPEREVDFVIIPHSISPQMVKDYPEVVNQARLFRIPNVQRSNTKENPFLKISWCLPILLFSHCFQLNW